MSVLTITKDNFEELVLKSEVGNLVRSLYDGFARC